MRAASLKRLGIPAGHHRLYGVNVPDAIYLDVKKLVMPIRKQGIEAAAALAGLLVKEPKLLDCAHRDLITELLAIIYSLKRR